MTRRVVTVLLPCMGLQVKTLERPELRERALVLGGVRAPDAIGRATGRPSSRPSSSSVVAECSQRAAAAGVRPGQTLAQARVTCPDLTLLEISEDEMALARQAVLEALLLVGPKVEWAGGGTFHVDATGLTGFHRSEHALLVRCWQGVEELGLCPRVGLASTRLASLLAARARVTAVIAPGGEAEFLAPHPLSLLPLPESALERLELMGVRTLGAFARLPADGLADRFDAAVTRWQRVVRGEEPEPLVAIEDSRGPSAVREMDEPVVATEAVTFLLKSCCEDLADELDRRGLAVCDLEMAFVLDVPRDQGAMRRDARRLRPVRALSRPRALLELCRMELEARPVAAPLLAIVLTAVGTAPAEAAAAELFGKSLDANALAMAVDRVRTLFGEASAVTPAPRAAHRREARVGWAPFDPRVVGARADAAASRVAEARPGERAALAEPSGRGERAALTEPSGPCERLLARPLSALVELADGERAGSLVVPAAERSEGACGIPAQADVLAQEGPLRVEGEWWPGGADVDRDEYLLLGGDGGLYRVCRDRRTRAWFVMGFVD